MAAGNSKAVSEQIRQVLLDSCRNKLADSRTLSLAVLCSSIHTTL